MKESVIRTLIDKKITIATAESCTGGMLGKEITSVSGASEIYGFGFITYANEAKMQLLGVKKETLEKYGAVSEQTAAEMAIGARKNAQSDIAVSTTGIAGPGGGTKEKPVGLVYISLAYEGGALVKKLNLSGDRDSVRTQTCENIFNFIDEFLKTH